MSISRAQFTLLGLFLTSLVLHLACFGYSYLVDAIYVEDVQKLAVRILAIYSVPVGVIVGGIFGRQGRPAARTRSSTFRAAAALCLLWNLLLLSRTALFVVARQDSVVSLLDYADAVAAAGTFLMSAALAYYFAK